MENTIVYLIRHADTLNENGIRKTNETNQIINEKEILSVKGEKDAKRISEILELNNIDTLWSSSYTRAKSTAKYIAENNKLEINIDERFNERKLGNLSEIAIFMKGTNSFDPSQEQLKNRTFKTSDGESCEDTRKRMSEAINEILKQYMGKNIVIVSHGGSIKFTLLNWCTLNNQTTLVYNNKELNINSPSVIKLIFNSSKELINLIQIV